MVHDQKKLIVENRKYQKQNNIEIANFQIF